MYNKSRWEYFKCRRCGKCCRELGLPYDPEFCFRLAELLNITVRDVINKYYGKMTEDEKNWESEDEKRKPCPLLIEYNEIPLCSVYAIRPNGCRAYPMDTDRGPDGVHCCGYGDAIDKLRREQTKEL